MKYLNLIFVTALFIISISKITAQTKTISGRVLDEHLSTLSMVKIQTLDSSYTTNTDANGNYSINLPLDVNKIKIQCLGMETEIFDLNENCLFNVILLDNIITEFETPEEHLCRLKKRKKTIDKIYERAIQSKLISKNKSCY